MAKFTMEEHDRRMKEIRERLRQPQVTGIQRLKEAIRQRGTKRI